MCVCEPGDVTPDRAALEIGERLDLALVLVGHHQRPSSGSRTCEWTATRSLLLHLGLDGVIDGVGAEVDGAADEGRGRLRAAALDVEDLDVEPFLGEIALRLGQRRSADTPCRPTPPMPDGDLLGRPAPRAARRERQRPAGSPSPRCDAAAWASRPPELVERLIWEPASSTRTARPAASGRRRWR